MLGICVMCECFLSMYYICKLIKHWVMPRYLCVYRGCRGQWSHPTWIEILALPLHLHDRGKVTKPLYEGAMWLTLRLL